MALIKVIGYTMASRRPTPKKKTAATMASPSQVARVTKKGTEQAGKPKAAGSSKAATITRQMQNKDIKEGTIRIGKAGRSYNVYDAKTGTWKRGVVVKADEKKPTTRSGNAKEKGLVKRPTHQNPSYGAEHIVGGTKGQPRYGNVIVNPSRRQSKAPRITRVSKKDR